ncbi:HET-domain-containing protein [Xylaria sp. FL0933]|nr:HET-domain-containing protein [Xylaria sp. FL0933]
MASASSVYQSLDPTLKRIRILELLPGFFENDLTGNLWTVTLNDKPSYTALSYTWGDRTERRTLKIKSDSKWTSKSIELPITDNLFRALRRLRRPLKTRVLWVDAICINQADTNERSAQVALMDAVYSNAASTAIWLGDTRGKSIYDKQLTTSHKLLQSVSSMFGEDSRFKRRWKGDGMLMSQVLQTTTPSWKDRGWIVQEYVLSQRPYLQFGSGIRTISRPDPLSEHRRTARPAILDEELDPYPDLWRLSERLEKLDEIRVYSLLSFVNPIERKLVSPDYHSSTEVVFGRATYAAFQGPTKFSILELIKFDTSGHPSTLPTWSYDFRTSALINPGHHLFQSGERNEITVPSLQVNQECTELKFEGICCDVAAELTLDLPESRSIYYIHDSHDINTEGWVVSETCRKAVELVGRAEKFFRGNEATVFSNMNDDFDIGVGHQRQEIISNLIFAKSHSENCAPYKLASSLFTRWESITTYLGIPRTSHRFQTAENEDLFGDIIQSMCYCEKASGSTTIFITTSGNPGIAFGTIEGGDRLVLPLCKTPSGEINARVTPFEKPLALILREGEDDKWTFHGLAHMERFGDKAQYMQHPRTYTIRDTQIL